MKNVFQKSMTVLLALTFILAISNLNGVNTSFADTEDIISAVQKALCKGI